MQQRLTSSPTIIDLNNEYRIKIEHIDEFQTSFFKDVYEQAKKHVAEIVNANKLYRDKLQEGTDGGSDVYNNIIVFEGERGKGKSSAMLSFRKALIDKNDRNSRRSFFDDTKLDLDYSFVALDVIDPSFFNGDETLFEIIVAKLFSQFKKQLDNYDYNFKITDDQKRNLVSAFQRVFEDIKCQEKKESIYEGDALDALIKLSASSNLKESFSKLLELYLEVFGESKNNNKNFLILTIDDFDLNISGMYQMMEDIRRFLINQSIIILMSCKFSQVKEATYLEFYKVFFNKVNYTKTVEFIIPNQEIILKGNRYIQKLIPSNRINRLKDLNLYNYELGLFNYEFNLEEKEKYKSPIILILPEFYKENQKDKNFILELNNLDTERIIELELTYDILIGDNFQNLFFKLFYKEKELFICNRKGNIYGLVPKTFRELYDINNQLKSANLLEYIGESLTTKLNLNLASIINFNNKTEHYDLYMFFLDVVNYAETKDFVLFNNYFIFNFNEKCKSFISDFDQIDLLGKNLGKNNPLNTSNSTIYTLLYEILDNNQLDSDIIEIVEYFILFYYLKNCNVQVDLVRLYRKYVPTYTVGLKSINLDSNMVARPSIGEFHFIIDSIYKKDDIKSLLEELSIEEQYFVLSIFDNRNTFISLSYLLNKINQTFFVPSNASYVLNLFKVFQPDFNVYIEENLKDETLKNWFIPRNDSEMRYTELFYNPIFFQRFIKEINDIAKNDYNNHVFFLDDVFEYLFDDYLNEAINNINKEYSYLNLSVEELYLINPLLVIYKKNKKRLKLFFKSLDLSLSGSQRDDHKLLESEKKKILKYLDEILNSNSYTYIKVRNLLSKTEDYLNNNSQENDFVQNFIQYLENILNNVENMNKYVSLSELEQISKRVEELIILING